MQPCKGETTPCAQFDCALAGLAHRYGMTQGCARPSLTLGYNIRGPSALHSRSLCIIHQAQVRVPEAPLEGASRRAFCGRMPQKGWVIGRQR